MKTSESLKSFAASFVKAQSQLKEANKNKLNPFYKSNYADLNSVWEAAKEALHSNGFTISQPTVFRDGVMLVETLLLHTSGEWIMGEYLVTTEKPGPQAIGAAVSYARRYALASIVGVTTGEVDDDGESATNHEKKTENVPASPATATAPAAASQVQEPPKSEWLMTRFVPASVTRRGDAYDVKDQQGQIYSTKSADKGAIAEHAKAKNLELSLSYVVNGKFRNIGKIGINEAEKPVQEVAF